MFSFQFTTRHYFPSFIEVHMKHCYEYTSLKMNKLAVNSYFFLKNNL